VWSVEEDLRIGQPVFDTGESVFIGVGPYDNTFGWADNRLVYSGLEGFQTLEQIEEAFARWGQGEGREKLQKSMKTWVREFPSGEGFAVDAACHKLLLGGKWMALFGPSREKYRQGEWVEVYDLERRECIAVFEMKRHKEYDPIPDFPLFWSADGQSFFAYGRARRPLYKALYSVNLQGEVKQLTGNGGRDEPATLTMMGDQPLLPLPAPVDGGRLCVALVDYGMRSTAVYIGYYSPQGQVEQKKVQRRKLPAQGIVTWTEDGRGMIVEGGTPPRIWCVDVDTYEARLIAEGVEVKWVYGRCGKDRWLVSVVGKEGEKERQRLAFLQIP